MGTRERGIPNDGFRNPLAPELHPLQQHDADILAIHRGEERVIREDQGQCERYGFSGGEALWGGQGELESLTRREYDCAR